MQGFSKPTLTRTTACYVMHKRMRDNPRIQQHTTQFTTKKCKQKFVFSPGKLWPERVKEMKMDERKKLQ